MWIAGVLSAALVWPAPVRARPPRDELLRLVPENPGFCFVLQDLRGHAKAFLDSAFAEQFSQSPFGVVLRNAPETRKLFDTAKFFQDRLQIDLRQLRDDILGDAVVLAFWPAPPGKPEQEQGLILVRAHDAEALSKLVDRFRALFQETANRTAPEVRKHNGEVYCAWDDGKRVTFSYVHGEVLAVSHQENLVQQVIDLDRRASATGEPALTAKFRRLGADKALAALLVNPRAFEPEIDQKAAQAEGVEGAVRRTLLAYWKALDGLAVFASVQKADLDLGLAFLIRDEYLPEPARQLLARGARPSELWDYFPPNALLTVAGRIDVVGLTAIVCQFVPDPVRKVARDVVDRYIRNSLGRDVPAEVLPYLGPDWGFCVTVRGADRDGNGTSRDAKKWAPDVVGAVRIQPDGREPALDRTLFNTLNGLALMAVFAYNNVHADQLSLQSVMQGRVEVRYVSNDKGLPAGVQPAFALKDGYLVVASSPAALRLFQKAATGSSLTAAGSEVPWIRLSLDEVRRFLKSRSEALAALIAEKDQVSQEEATRRLNELLGAIQLFDRLEVSQRSAPGQLTLLLRIRTAQPMR
jgi:hypothetical protein